MHNGQAQAPTTVEGLGEVRPGGSPVGAESPISGRYRSEPPGPEPVSTLRFYLAVIRRRRWPMGAALLIPIVIAVALTVTATKQYQGTALVVVNRQSLADQVTGSADPTASASDFLNIITTYADAARSVQVADRVAAAVPAAHLSGRQILAAATVTPKQDADVVQFAVTNPDPQLAQQLAAAFAHQFVRYQQGLDGTSLAAALAQVDSRLRQARAAHDRSLVSSLSGRDEQLRTLATLQTANNYVVNPTTSASLASPRKSLNIGLGVVGGIVLAALVAATLEALDTRVRSSDEVESIVQAPLIGRLGPPPAEYRHRVVSLRDPAHAHAEGFRMLRTSLELQAIREPAKVFMVTSAAEREGKSVTIANLAVAAARAGRRVVLVDLDLRRPEQDTLFECEAGPGLTEVLLGHVSLPDALVEIPLPAALSADGAPPEGSLRLLRAGVLPPDPGEVVASDQAELVIGRLRDEADVVYVDCPPMLVAGDALAISRFCDVVFVVTRLSRARRPALAELARGLRATPARVVGFVATGDPRSRAAAYG